jgi:putative ABC transport system ATP-binding protein
MGLTPEARTHPHPALSLKERVILSKEDATMIDLKDITKIYRKNGGMEMKVLQGVSLKIEKGEYVAIMAPSGMGKSTLMNIIGCLDRPTAGEYRLDGIEVDTMDDDNLSSVRNKKIGFVFQSFNLLARTTALENVQLPLIYNTEESDMNALASKALEEVGLGDRKHYVPSELSGGQQQRVAIARSLVNDPSILLADEPTGNLDTASSTEVMSIFDKLHADGRTIVMVTHSDEIAQRAQRIIRMRDGKIVSDEKKN